MIFDFRNRKAISNPMDDDNEHNSEGSPPWDLSNNEFQEDLYVLYLFGYPNIIHMIYLIDRNFMRL